MTTKQEFNCVFCKDVFENKEEFQEHFRKHGDPMYKKRFEIDTQVTDEKSKEKVELVSCDVCAQVFPTISKAITHKHKVHPDHDAKYFCPWCGKLFTLKHLYNVHVQSSHGDQEKIGDKTFRCDSCNVDFFVPSAMMNHNKFFHRQDSDLPDVGSSKKYKFYNQEIIHIYYCAFCGEEYENKVNLFKHMTDDHADENQSPDEVLKCPLCEAVFYHLDAYEIHLTFHSPEDMYTVTNDEFGDILDFSLESVPPIIEKVENLEPEAQNDDADPESTINAVGIERFLELAMDHSDDSNPVKVKKHKKHKKSKKSAITLDEFLSMNQDVFGEGLDFQGIEEVPTRVVKKQLKNNKKLVNAVTSAELDKLKRAGIVIKKKVCRNPVMKNLKVTPLKGSAKSPQVFNKINTGQEITTSSEVLTKLINQSNNQIKIVKKNNLDNTTNEQNRLTKDIVEECQTSHENSSVNVTGSDLNNTQMIHTPVHPSNITQDEEDINKDLSFPDLKEVCEPTTIENALPNKNIKAVKQTTKDLLYNNINMHETTKRADQSPKPENDKDTKGFSNKIEGEIYKNESDRNYSDPEFNERENESEEAHVEVNHKHIDDIKETSDNNSNQDTINTSRHSSLSSLKHLSHLITVKPVSQNKNNTLADPTNTKVTENKDRKSDIKSPRLPSPTDRSNPSISKIVVDKDPTLGALKNLSKNIIIKSLPTKRNIDESKTEEDIEEDLDVSGNKNTVFKKIKVETNEPKLDHKKPDSLNSQETMSQPAKTVISKQPVGLKPTKTIVENAHVNPQAANANILKRLSNITTKSISNKNDFQPPAKQTDISSKFEKSEEKKEEVIEIFDIDDSEDENEFNSYQPEPSQHSVKSMDAFKNLSKNLTVKSLNQQSVQKNIKVESNIKLEKQYEDNYSNNKDEDKNNVEALIKMQNRNMTFPNVLKGLSKNITIKSRNSSPSQSVKHQNHTDILNSSNTKIMEDDDENDSNSFPSGNIKIKEIDDDISDDNLDDFEKDHDQPIVEHPSDSCSDNEEINEKGQDFEAEIKVNAVVKSNQTPTANNMCLNNLRNISKNITIKSLNKGCTDKEDKLKATQMQGNLETTSNQKKQMPMKLAKHITKDPVHENVSNSTNFRNIGQMVEHTPAQSSKQKTSAVNQTNTINKEVTVKTIQTKTMIQEITTTVTKTIKTINQTMKQEVRNTFQTNTPMVTQRVQGIAPSQSKNLKGVVVRHAQPNLAKTSNTLPQIRPAAGIVVRPSKHVVPVKTGVNFTRPSNPRMPVAKKVTPSPNPNKQIIGKPLKIAPTAMSSAIIKRPNSEDVSGPFSCFKKPKESLIPVSDIPTFPNNDGETTAQFSSASHTSSSNFTSTSKIVKGNSVITAKVVKSEVNSTNQLLNRVNNTTGIKMMSSQVKQTQVQEKSDSNVMKRTTLEAIQRLQQQGLLVKKPRVDIKETSAVDDHNDGNVDYSSADEHDE